MDTNFDFQSVPYTFTFCFQHKCPKAENCLRNIAAQNCTSTYPTLRIINPVSIPADAKACPHFLPDRKIRVAWGTNHLLDNVPYKDVYQLKHQLMAYFGRGKYYRFYRKEKYLTPDDQAFIRNTFRQIGIKDEPVYESYSEEYQWDK